MLEEVVKYKTEFVKLLKKVFYRTPNLFSSYTIWSSDRKSLLRSDWWSPLGRDWVVCGAQGGR